MGPHEGSCLLPRRAFVVDPQQIYWRWSLANLAGGPLWMEFMKKALLVVGMHRSGTSALAGALSILGVDVGEDLLPAKSGENERGFFELKEVHAFHDRLLLSGGRTWDTPWTLPPSWLDRFATPSSKAELIEILERNFADSNLWAVKDPRLCQLLPLWREVLADLGVDVVVIHIVREPGAVARSLANRNAFPAEKSGALWLDYNLTAENDSRGLQRAFVSYETLLDQKMATLEDLGAQLEIAWPRRANSIAADIEDFLTRDLDHTGKSSPSPAPGFGRWTEVVAELYELLRDLSVGGGRGEVPREVFDRFRVRQETLEEEFDPILIDHCIHLALGSGGLRDAQMAVDSTGGTAEAAKAYAKRLEEDLRNAQNRETSSRDFIVELEDKLEARRVHAVEVGSYAKVLETSLQEKEKLIRDLEDEIAKLAGLITGHERVLKEAARYNQSLESELEKHKSHQIELTRYTQKLVSELEKHQVQQRDLASNEEASPPAESHESQTPDESQQGHD